MRAKKPIDGGGSFALSKQIESGDHGGVLRRRGNRALASSPKASAICGASCSERRNSVSAAGVIVQFHFGAAEPEVNLRVVGRCGQRFVRRRRRVGPFLLLHIDAAAQLAGLGAGRRA